MKAFVKIGIWLLFGIGILVFLLYDNEKADKRINNPIYTEGTILGKSKAAKGERYLDYQFYVDGKLYTGSISIAYCNDCNTPCCEIGSTLPRRVSEGTRRKNSLIKLSCLNAC